MVSSVEEALSIFGLVVFCVTNIRCHIQINTLGADKQQQWLKSNANCTVPYSEGTSYLLPGCNNDESYDDYDEDDCLVGWGSRVVGNGSVLALKCSPAHSIRRSQRQNQPIDMAVCYDGQWYPKKHSCIRTCTGITLDTLDKNCTYDEQPVSCENDVRIGTRATLSCKSGFQADRENQENYCLKTGKWKFEMNNCAAICGEVGNEENDKNRKPGIFRNKIETIDAGYAPWNAGVYLAQNATYKLICGGTLISEEFIISAINCVVNEKGSVRPPSTFGVALGKTYKGWSDERDLLTAQKFKVVEILSYEFFESFFSGNQGIINFARHIVVLRVRGMVKFNMFVAPVCLDIERYNGRYNQLIGMVVGWSTNNNDSVSLTKFLKPVETNSVCKQKLKSDEKIDNPSKFCTQRIDQLGNHNYGAGLVFKDIIGTQKYYVIGILTEHFADVSVYLGFRDKTSMAIIKTMKLYFDRAKDVKSIQ